MCPQRRGKGLARPLRLAQRPARPLEEGFSTQEMVAAVALSQPVSNGGNSS
jgi:hypothetical protein